MKRFVFTSALLVACVIAGPAGHAQSRASRRRSRRARNAAERSLRAGRFDEVDTAGRNAFPKDEILAVLRAQALIAKGEYAKAEPLLQPFATEKPTGDAALELGLLQQYLGRRGEARRTLQLLLLNECQLRRGARLRTGGAGGAGAGPVRGRELALSRGGTARAERRGDRDARGAICSSRNTTGRRRRESYQAALKADPDYQPAHLGMARAVADDNPPAATKYVQRALELNPNDAAAHLFLAELAIDNDKKNEARAAIDKAQAINPNSLEAHALAGAPSSSSKDNDAEYKTAVAAALKLNPLYGEAYRVVGSGDGAVLPVRRGRRAGAARHRHRSRECPGAGRSRRRI